MQNSILHLSKRIVLIACLFFSVFAYGATSNAMQTSDSMKNAKSIAEFIHGDVIVIDMNQDGKVSKETVLQGSDLILVKLETVEEEQHRTHQSIVISAVHPEDLKQFDINHNGTIDRNDFNATQLALLRIDRDNTFTIAPLANSTIKQIQYQVEPGAAKSNKGKLKIELITDKDKKFATFYLNFP